jgi:RecA-family ATPase
MITAKDLDKRYPYPHQIWQNLSDKTRESVIKCLSHLDDPLDFLDRNEKEKGRFIKEAATLAPMTVIKPDEKPMDKGRPSPRVLPMSGRQNEGSSGTTLDELMALPEDDRSFLVYPIIPRSKISMLAGKSDVGKSMFYIQLCTAIILGRSKFLDMIMEPKYRRALIITTEDDRYDIRFRLGRQLAGMKLNKAQSVNLKVVDDTTEIVPVLEVELSMKRYDLVVIDAFGDVFEGNINATNDVRRFLTSISMVLNRYQCAALIIHHEGKATSKKGPQKDKILGSSGIEQRCRSVAILSADPKLPGRRTLQVVKGNHISDEEKAKVHRYIFDSETFTYSVDPNAVGEDEGNAPSNKYTRKYPQMKQRGRKGPTEAEFNQAKEMREAGKTLQEIGEALNRNSSTICRWFKEPPRWDTRRVGKVG